MRLILAMHRICIKTVAFGILLLSVGAVAQTPHHPLHALYEQWRDHRGVSCCNQSDCHGAEAWRFVTVGYEVRIDGTWYTVPPERVRPYSSPDGGAHVCNIGSTILCFVPGSGA